MLGEIGAWPRLLSAGRQAAGSLAFPPGRSDKIIFCGLGGSAIAADIVQNLTADSCPVPQVTCRDWALPVWAGRRTLYFLLSYSGNTYETLRAAAAVRRRQGRVIVLSSGGALTRLARRNGWPVLPLPPGLPPRSALPFFIGALLTSLEKLGLTPGQSGQFKAARAAAVRSVRENLTGTAGRRPACRLAKALAGRIPLIMTVPQLAGAARRWVNQFNENSKITAAFSLFPELTHNEIVGLADRSAAAKYFPIILRPARCDRGLDLIIGNARARLARNFGRIPVITARGPGRLAQTVDLISLGDFVSVYLAQRRGVDPLAIPVIDALKKRLQAQLG